MMPEPAPSILSAALAAHDAGLCVVRAAVDGSKKPLGTWLRWQAERPTRQQVEAWFADNHPGIGIVTGAVSGDIEMFELEGRFMAEHKAAFIQAINQAGLALPFKRIMRGFSWHSPSGGANFLYRTPGPIDGNTKLAANTDHETLIETRGEGGFVILPPSHGTTHPSGVPWTMRYGSFAEIPTLTTDEREAIFTVACTFNQAIHTPPPPVEPQQRFTTGVYGGLVGESWMDAVVTHINGTSLRTLLEDYGWTYCYDDRHGRQLLRRPGKDEGVSASINTSGRLHVFSTSTPFQAGRTTFDALDIIATYEHRSDRIEAGRHIAQQAGIRTHNRPVLPPDVDPETGEIAPPTSTTFNLPDDFWTARPALEHIRQAAHSRTRSADAVLAFVLARVATLIPPTTTLPPIVGSAASLNHFGAVVASSGGGKSSAKDVAGELVPITFTDILDDIPLGSGEGLTEAFFEFINETDDDGKTRKVKRQTKRAAFVYLDEGQALAEMGNRKGSTLLSTLRSAWSGSTIGQQNASVETHRRLGAHKYRLALMVGFQLEYATALVDDAAGGTPQRFVFSPATDPAIPDEAPHWPGPLPLQIPPIIQTGTQVDIATSVSDGIRARQLAAQRGQLHIDPLDTHGDLVRLKVATLLGILDDRDNVTEDDWRLAGMIMRTSAGVRAWIIEEARLKRRIEEQRRQDIAGRLQLAITDTVMGRSLERAATAIGRRAHRDPEATYTKRDFTQAIASRDRQHVSTDEAIEQATRMLWITPVDGGWSAGKAKPA